MADLPALSESTKRILELRSVSLLSSYRLTEDAVIHYASAGDMNRRIALGRPPETTSRYLKSWLTTNLRAKLRCGISSSVQFAESRFQDLAAEYLQIWSPSAGCELFTAQLDVLKTQVLAELAAIWKKSEATERWYEGVCASAVNTAVSQQVAVFEGRARSLEIALLVRSRIDESAKPLDRAQLGTAPATGANKGPIRQRRKRGPTPAYETAARVAEIVVRIAPDGNWRSKLDDLCEALDDDQIPTPKTWRPKHGFKSWFDAGVDTAARGRHMAIEAIKHHLKLAKERPTETIP